MDRVADRESAGAQCGRHPRAADQLHRHVAAVWSSSGRHGTGCSEQVSAIVPPGSSGIGRGVASAIAAAIAFGVTTPIGGWAGQWTGPLVTAALLYAGAAGSSVISRRNRDAPLRRG